MLVHLSSIRAPHPTSVKRYTMHAYAAGLDLVAIALLTVRCGVHVVCVGGGDEGGHPLPGLRRQSQEAHLQNGRYVPPYSYYPLLVSYVCSHLLA